MPKTVFFAALSVCTLVSFANAQNTPEPGDRFTLLTPDRVFTGEAVFEGWQVLVKNDRIEAVGPAGSFPCPKTAVLLNLKGTTLLPGLIEGHAHLFLHPYNETTWNDQVLKESRAERIARATLHARRTLEAGFTTVRDLGTEGAGFDDAGLKTCIEKNLIPGPRMLIATKAIVATGSYGPKSSVPDIDLPQGAAEADGTDGLIREARTQIGKGADLIKVYADYRWGARHEAQPTFTLDELKTLVEVVRSSGRQVVAHATTEEGMRRAALAGCATIEHGDDGTEAVFRLMKEKNVALCPTLAATEATSQYQGWKKGQQPDPPRVARKKQSFAEALRTGTTICFGGDVGVFAHGDNAREMELMVEYGMPPIAVLRAATAVNAEVFGLANQVGSLRKGLMADMIAVRGNPVDNITAVRQIRLVMKGGNVVIETKEK